MDGPTFFISAGDPSGDIACSRLVHSLRALNPNLRLCGLGGPRLKALGQEQLVDGSQLAVLGFWEVVKKAAFFRQLLDRCANVIARQKPACVLLVDYPGFNLRLAARIKSLGIPIIYYISPQIWAWGRHRAEQIRRLIDLVIVILPFEESFYRAHGVNVQYVGHYLLEDIPAEYISSAAPQGKRIALLPGSRPQEIERMLPVMLEAAMMFNQTHDTTATVAALKNQFRYDGIMQAADPSIGLSYESSRRIVFESDLVLTASGTATLEAGIIGRPMVIVYRTGRITYQIARRLVKIDSIGLVNLVLNDKVVPELIQDEVTPARMAQELDKLWTDTLYYERVRARLMELPGLLHGSGASDRAAKLISAYI